MVRPLTFDDRAGWLPMWRQYCAFYETELPETTSAITFERLCDSTTPMHGTLAIDEETGAALGFAHIIVHPFTWSSLAACYLENLFVEPDSRGRGIGRALIENLIERAESEGWARLYWMTREGNTTARRLYDALATRDDFIRYAIAFGDAPRD